VTFSRANAAAARVTCMKYCPICDERFDDEAIRFCTKDGTPLVEDTQPNLTATRGASSGPLADDDDPGEHTRVISRKAADNGGDTAPIDREAGDRIVIPTTIPTTTASFNEPPPPPVRPRVARPEAYYAPPQPNTGKVVALTIVGTLAVLGFGALLFWALQRNENTNINVNTNPPNLNANLNTNGFAFDANFNFNANSIPVNVNALPDIANTVANAIANSATPQQRTPTPTPRVTPSPQPTDDPDDPPPSPTPVRPPANGGLPTPTVRTTPRPPANTTRTPSNTNTDDN
jgi:hypothetical protein